ncbi:interleukin-2 receptor subunit alpha-like isoform X2 [Phaenicophaeus curvirostris]|uniref:interleukin-2 receptor subunit alpha-like isoform X2 n=1 Tax=Phaenicophaeus curvirostris TaxID=33595 RepID=UPI0037F0DC7E
MELKSLLMWLLLGSIKGSKPEECPVPPVTEFADVTAEMYALGTRLYYQCDSGYKRSKGQYMGIECKRSEHGASWEYAIFQCIEKKDSFSAAPMKELDFTQKPENKTERPALQLQENLSEFGWKDFCGPPKTMPHASLSSDKRYHLGQVLHFKCQSGFDKQLPISGTISCKKVNGKITWTPLEMRCTNDSSYIEELPPQTIEQGSNHPSFSSSVILPVTAIFLVLVIIPCVFV